MVSPVRNIAAGLLLGILLAASCPIGVGIASKLNGDVSAVGLKCCCSYSSHLNICCLGHQTRCVNRSHCCCSRTIWEHDSKNDS